MARRASGVDAAGFTWQTMHWSLFALAAKTTRQKWTVSLWASILSPLGLNKLVH